MLGVYDRSSTCIADQSAMPLFVVEGVEHPEAVVRTARSPAH
jgi:hypothetical protein